MHSRCRNPLYLIYFEHVGAAKRIIEFFDTEHGEQEESDYSYQMFCRGNSRVSSRYFQHEIFRHWRTAILYDRRV